MKQIELSTGTLLVVAADLNTIKVDLNGFQLLGHPSEITGEVWWKVVTDEYGLHMVHEGMIYDTPLQSGLSLCAAHGIKETDVLLFKPKAEPSNPNENPDGYHHETGRNEY